MNAYDGMFLSRENSKRGYSFGRALATEAKSSVSVLRFVYIEDGGGSPVPSGLRGTSRWNVAREVSMPDSFGVGGKPNVPKVSP